MGKTLFNSKSKHMTEEQKNLLIRQKKIDSKVKEITAVFKKDLKENKKTKGGLVGFHQNSWVVKEHASSPLKTDLKID